MTETDDDARRWAEALAMVQGVDDLARRRVRRNRTFLFVAVVLVLSWAFGVVLALALPRGAVGADGGDPTSDLRVDAALVIEAVGLAAMIAGFVWALRTGRYLVRWKSIASPLTRRQRRLAQRAIAGKVHLDRDHAPYLLALAVQNRRTTEGVTPLYGGVLILESATLVLHPALWAFLLAAVVVVLFLIAAVQLTALYRRSGRFLAQHE